MSQKRDDKPKIEKIIITGEGGQGNLLLGRFLAYCGMQMDKSVSFLPSFGFEDGEGNSTANVILSERPIGAPLVYVPDILIVSNQSGFNNYYPRVKGGGVMIINSSAINREVCQRDDIRIVEIPATALASKIGNEKVANMILGGAYIALSTLVDMPAVLGSIQGFLKDLQPAVPKKFNQQALETGYNFIKDKKYMHARFLHQVFTR